MIKSIHTTGPRCRRPRFGLAAVEFAVVLPIMAAIVFGGMEASNAIHLKQTLTSSAYEAARTITATGGTQGRAQTRFDEIVAAQNIQQATITFSPAVNSSTASGTLITVTATAPATVNSYAPAWYYNSAVMTTTVRMVRQ